MDRSSTCEVGSFPAGRSRHGLFDMAGNVWEWTGSRYCDYPEKRCNEAARVRRGGGWGRDLARLVRGADRLLIAPSGRSYRLGVRCAR